VKTAAFRFRKSQVRRLRQLADMGRERPDIDSSLFDKAADATATGEALHIGFTDRSELDHMRSAFVRLGVVEPEVEDLSVR
jgi:hypothetical protein